jgi:hypothetical protein
MAHQGVERGVPEPQRKYSAMVRLTFQRGRIVKSHLVPVGKFDFFDEADRTAKSVDPKEFGKQCK